MLKHLYESNGTVVGSSHFHYFSKDRLTFKSTMGSGLEETNAGPLDDFNIEFCGGCTAIAALDPARRQIKRFLKYIVDLQWKK